ncbi:MAG TPA: hypothetical protein PK313_00160 [Myxococcota bacterium]|nr:hypothetical protein [Myxococcota bacterium]
MRRHAGTGFPAAMLIAALALGGGCKAPAPAEAVQAAAQATPTADPGVPAAAGKATCEAPVHDYGTVAQGDKVAHTFTIKNTGDGVLHILSARGG